MPRASFSMLLYCVATPVTFLMFWEPHYILLSAADLLLNWHLMPLVLDIVFFIIEFHGSIFLDDALHLAYNFWYVLFNVNSLFADVNLLNRTHTSLVDAEKYFIIPKMIVALFNGVVYR